jgi:ankyrin repeat protein
MRRRCGVLGAQLFLALLASGVLMQTAGCSEVKFGGETAKEVFKVPGVVALAEAGCAGDLTKMDALAKQGVDVNATGDQGGPVLLWVLGCKNYAGVEKLLSLGANPNYKVGGTDSVMWIAAAADDPKWLPLMLAHGGDPNIWSGARSALMLTVSYNRQQNFKLLLEHGVDVNAHDIGHNSAATYAVAERKYDIVIDLLNHGYNYELPRLARAMNNLVTTPNSKVSVQRKQILGMLKERGVELPPPPSSRSGSPSQY